MLVHGSPRVIALRSRASKSALKPGFGLVGRGDRGFLLFFPLMVKE